MIDPKNLAAIEKIEKAKNHYEALGVQPNATPAEVKKAYYALSKNAHPDKNNNDSRAEAAFKKIGSAYETLMDPDKRKRYDLSQPSPSSASKKSDFGEALFNKLSGALKSFCSSVSKFVDSLINKQEARQEGPKQ